MIYDKLKNIENYKGINPNLDVAIDFITKNDLNTLPLGKTPIAGELVYVNVMDAATVSASSKSFEFHENYMDIQIDLSGSEIIQTGDCTLMETEQYDSPSDSGSATCPLLASCTMGIGNFTICMSGEPHKPGIMTFEPETIRKCVFKVHK